MSHDLIRQLKELKHNPRAGAVSDSVARASRESLLEAIGGASEKEFYGWRDYVAYGGQLLSVMVYRPVAVGVSVFVIVLGGWMTTVSAASQSLPGETLYGLKLVTERARLSVASYEERAVLHTEFAQRRLEEAMALSQSTNPDAQEYVAQAMEAFAQELASADSQMKRLAQGGGDEAASVAQEVDQHIERLSSALETAEAANEKGVDAAAVKEAEEVTNAISDAATDVLVEVNEQREFDETSSIALSRKFKTEMLEIQNRQTFNLGRLAVIANAAEDESLTLSASFNEDTFRDVEFAIQSATDQLSQAEGLIAVGGFRTAFDILYDIDESLLAIEIELAQMEAAIIDARSDAARASATESEEGTVLDEPVEELEPVEDVSDTITTAE